MNLFGKKDKKDESNVTLTEVEGLEEKYEKLEKEYPYHWTYRELADVLGVAKSSLWEFINRRRKARHLIQRRYSKDWIPKEVADRILGLKSNPPEDIDELEYSYPIGWLADKMGINKKKLKKRLKDTGLEKYIQWDGRGRRIPRSICKILYPYLELRPGKD